jgi:hypothetical protein
MYFEKSQMQPTFRTVRTDRQDFHDLFLEINPDIVLFEVGTSVGWVADMLRSLKYQLLISTPSDRTTTTVTISKRGAMKLQYMI